MDRHRLVGARGILLALPPAAVTLALTAFAAAEMAGYTPLTVGRPLSVAEAVAMRDGSSAARLAEGGAQIIDVQLVRRGVLADQPVLATPLEAAVLVDDAVMFEYLRSRGAVVDAGVACLAADVGARNVAPLLGGGAACHAGDAWLSLVSRP